MKKYVISISAEPTWREIPTNINRTEGQTVNFLCKGDGEPVPTTVWYKDAEPLVGKQKSVRILIMWDLSHWLKSGRILSY